MFSCFFDRLKRQFANSTLLRIWTTYNWSLNKETLLGRTSPYRPFSWVQAPLSPTSPPKNILMVSNFWLLVTNLPVCLKDSNIKLASLSNISRLNRAHVMDVTYSKMVFTSMRKKIPHSPTAKKVLGNSNPTSYAGWFSRWQQGT